jgi:DNA-binding NtrC family response regulator
MPPRQQTILNVALNESLLTARSAILEEAGYEVVPALNIVDVQKACEHQGFDLVIIGYALPKDEKRRVMLAVRRHCGAVPILELYPHGTTPADEEADEMLSSLADRNILLSKVSECLSKPRNRRRGAS